MDTLNTRVYVSKIYFRYLLDNPSDYTELQKYYAMWSGNDYLASPSTALTDVCMLELQLHNTIINANLLRLSYPIEKCSTSIFWALVCLTSIVTVIGWKLLNNLESEMLRFFSR